ncbi:MAG: CPBP family intramembrane metalloprotease [Lachnospiraceae bacterium]|nr:CPBP family intramembrane metalloprotease [Lachnospiraceae bacterium]
MKQQEGMRKLWDIVNPFVGILCCMLVSTMIGTMGFGLLTGLNGLNNEMMLELFPWLSLVITLICCILTVILMRNSLKMDQVRFGFDRHTWTPIQYAAATALGAAAGYVWSTVIQLSGIARVFTGYENTAAKAFQGQPLPLLIITTVIAAPIAEELVFRCMIYRRARHYYGIWPAAVISAVLFGIYHANMIQFIYALGFSAVLIFLYEKSGNILAPILAHAGSNLLAVILDSLLH